MLTREQVRQVLDKDGVTIASWARAHGYEPEQVYDVMRGRAKGRSGVSHNIAVELGIKAGRLNTRGQAGGDRAA